VAGDSNDASHRGLLGSEHDSVDASPPPARKPDLERGRTIGRYVVLYELGSGGMGVVYAAYDPELDRKIALKILHGDTTSTRGRQRLMREAKAIAKLTHTNVVTVHDVGTYEGRVFLAMEFVDGVTLRQWLRERPRPWADALDVLCAAGAGLAAAHAAELIHRDFKPDNVLVDRTGRVVVLDFGLARRAPTHDDERGSSGSGIGRVEGPRSRGSARSPSMHDAALEERLEQLAARSGSFDVDLTRTGALLGTPAYMAPEQHLGNTVDARSDQFSFCVVLWEAIYGVRPFRGESATSTAVNVVKGMLQEPPKGSGVPGWLRRVLGRGLSIDPHDRYPDMHALLGALRRDATRRVRRRVGFGATLAGIGAGAAVAYAIATREPAACDGGAERLAGVWDDSVRTQVREMFLATDVRYAPTAYAGVESTLDGYATRWIAQHREACLATHIHREQSAELLDLRMACLRTRLGELSALTAEFRHADAALVEHAVEAAAGLGRLEACADTRALAARVLPPADETIQAAAQGLRERLADARAKESAGRYASALGVAEAVAHEASMLGYAPVIAEARLRLGSALERTGEFAAAERAYLEAIWNAEAARHEVVAADAWVRLVWVTGVERGDTAQGEIWARFADAAVDRIGTDELLRATLTHNRGGVLYRQQRLEEAFDHYREALEVQQRLLGPDDPVVAMSYNHMGNVKIEQNDLITAEEYVNRSYELRRRVLGERHPKVAASINNLAAIAAKQRHPERALEHAEHALSIVGGSGGAEEVVSLTMAADAATDLGTPGRATPFLERLLAVREQASPPVPAAVADARVGLATDAEAQGKLPLAVIHLEAAIELRSGFDPNGAARALLELARLEELALHPERAAAAIDRARGLAEAANPRDAGLLAELAATTP
jgi:tetratricopeptide (TPR) repeat protein/predicted Ser/Thr protein kinase